MNCFTISAEIPFIPALARWILDAFGADAGVFTKTLILLPNRRACRALREAFLACTGGKPMLLPRIQPIGDMDNEEIHFSGFAGDIPPAISLVRRELLLTNLVRNFSEAPVEQATELARQLARFIDDAAREGLSFDGLAKLVPEELAAHWQQTLSFLEIVSRHWPQILEEEGAIDPIEHRNRLLAATALAWEKNPPDYPVIAAGSTGSQPATAMLLSAIAKLPQGRVILPGLDKDMPDAQWDMVSETHPQFALKALLKKMNYKRENIFPLPLREGIKGWGGHNLAPNFTTPHPNPPPQGGRERLECLRAILQPPEATSGWTTAVLPLAGLQGLRLLTADTLQDEARLIAIALREALETPEKTAALVTPDRALARMVAAQMQRFGVAIDDSAGMPLMDTPPAVFMRLAADMAASRAAPAALLALLRHPFAAVGLEPAECRALSRQLEIKYLRGIRRMPGLEALCDAAKDDKPLSQLLNNLVQRTQGFTDNLARKNAPLRELLTAHMQCAEALSSSSFDLIEGSGAAGDPSVKPKDDNKLWAGQAGNDLAAFLAELLEHADALADVDTFSYPALFDTLLATEIFRPPYGLHPRLHILSPQEARLMRFDRVILGSLNEGTWPAAPTADPWMSRPMRAAFGLPSPERSIGQSAHDVYMLSAAPEVFLTRAKKVEGAPTVASRWLVRLETLVAGLDKPLFSSLNADAHYESGKRLLDAPADLPMLLPPAPIPPMEARPRQLRVTAIDTWLRDPYVIYAQYILKLKALEPLDREPDAADFGTLVHRALEQFAKKYPKDLPANAQAALLECGRAAFAEFIDRPAVASLWWPRFEAMSAWFIDREKERRGGLIAVLGELKGVWTFEVDGNPFTLTTRIDRLEMLPDGTAIIADYKTGYVPANSDIERGLANQLPLEALIVKYGVISLPNRGRDGVGALLSPSEQLSPPPNLPPNGGGIKTEYWKLAGNPEDCSIEQVSEKREEGMDAWLEHTKKRLFDVIRAFNHPDMVFAAQENPALQITRYNDYAQLTRRQEWETI